MLFLVRTWAEWEKYRSAIIPLLERVCKARNILPVSGVDTMIESIARQKETLVLDLNGQGECISLATVEMVQYPKQLVFRVNAAAGTFDDNWINHLAELENLGKSFGAQAFEFWARPGFHKFLKKAGYHISMYNYVKEVVKENG